MTVLEIKAAVRARDGFRCTECGLSNEEHLKRFGNALHVHRKEPGERYTVAGSVTLCAACHKGKPKSPRGSFRDGRVAFVVDARWLGRTRDAANRLGFGTVSDFIRYAMTKYMERVDAERLRAVSEESR